ncbi:flavoprotein [Nonomuraea sp. NPDC003707]
MSDSHDRLVPPPPGFEITRLLYVGTGCLCVAFMPYWLNWLRMACPGTEVRTIITRSAERFVSRAALAALNSRDISLDVWSDQPEPRAPHVELARWPEAIVVHPASMHFVSRLALGIADTPVLLALQCTDTPIAVAPALPPGGVTSAVYRRHRDALAERGNVVVVPPIPGYSVTSRTQDATVAAPLPEVLAALGSPLDLAGQAAGSAS